MSFKTLIDTDLLRARVISLLEWFYYKLVPLFSPVRCRVSSDLARHGNHSNTSKILQEFKESCLQEDVFAAAHHLNQIIDSGSSIHITTPNRFMVVLHISADDGVFSDSSTELLALDYLRLKGVARWALISLMVAFMQTMYRRGEPELSRDFADSYAGKHRQHHLLTDVLLAQEWEQDISSDMALLVDSMASGGLGYREYFRGRYCSKPFEDFEIRADGEIFVCCPSYLPYPIGNIYHASGPKDVLGSRKHARIRDSILQQDFRYCRWLHCNLVKAGLSARDSSSSLEYRPTHFRLSYDQTCNLWCPSCRSEKLVAKGLEQKRLLRLTDEVVLPLLKTGHSCMMNGYGDIFASKACRHILESVNREDFPDLFFDLISNGVLLTEGEWQRLPQIHPMVRSIRISIDAGNRTTYDILRLGGDWDILQQNLRFIAELRKSGVIEQFLISFVVQAENFMEMPEFARMGKRLGCDLVVFELLMDWNTFSPELFRQKAVHYRTHPLYDRYVEQRAQVLDILPRDSLENVVRLGQPGYETLAAGGVFSGET
jgi:hypothetical protein